MRETHRSRQRYHSVDASDIYLWKMDEVSGTTLINKGTTGSADFSIIGSATAHRLGSGGAFQPAILVDTTNANYLEGPILSQTGDLSWMAWLQPTTYTSGASPSSFLHINTDGSGNPAIALGITSAYSPFCTRKSAGASADTYTSSLVLKRWMWTHFCGVHFASSGDFKFYINAIEQTTSPYANTGNIDWQGYKIRVGYKTGNANDKIQGGISNMRIRSEAVSAQWIKDEFVMGIGRGLIDGNYP